MVNSPVQKNTFRVMKAEEYLSVTNFIKIEYTDQQRQAPKPGNHNGEDEAEPTVGTTTIHADKKANWC